MTEWIYVDRTKYADDGCDWTPAILWQMNASARARSRAVYIPAPRPVQVAKPSAPMIRRTPVAATPGDKNQEKVTKTHIGIVIHSRGEKIVRLHETATAWSVSGQENYDKRNGTRIGASGASCLMLETIKPAESKVVTQESTAGSELSAQALVTLMQDKTLSYQAILTTIKLSHPEVRMSMSQLQNRIKGMMQSKLVALIRHDDLPVTHFTLGHVDPGFYALSSKNLKG
ncbi:MAG: hypothetical protein E7H83_14300 [Enterobacteriaceae bacterium]|nr:hypothetical protein [Enterobacteriaceae bacterium]